MRNGIHISAAKTRLLTVILGAAFAAAFAHEWPALQRYIKSEMM
jgi:hypothetical protein